MENKTDSEVERFQLTCEACETPYTFARVVTDADEAGGVFCRCPNCGLPGSDQILAHQYKYLSHKIPDWFIREKEHFLQQLQPGGHFQGGRYHKGGREIPVTGDEWLKSHKGE